MILKNVDMYTLLNNIKDKTLICFGAGRQLQGACEKFSDQGLFNKIGFIADNNSDKRSFSFLGETKPVYTIEHCIKHAKAKPVILITVLNCVEIVEQLNAISELDNCEGYIYTFVRDRIKPYNLPKGRALHEPLKIPKKIHYCWFGGAKLPDEFIAYMESWKRFCPDYEIVRWDESNYDYKKNAYMYEAYQQKKWGFVPDYARLDIINEHGGVYLDTDVELVANIDDLLCDEAFCGFEGPQFVNYGSGFGAVAGFPIIRECLDIYDKVSFINDDGSLNLTPSPRYQTEYLVSKGLERNNSLQTIQGMTVYPSDVLCPLNFGSRILSATNNTYAIHHFAASWVGSADLAFLEGGWEMYKRLADACRLEEVIHATKSQHGDTLL